MWPCQSRIMRSWKESTAAATGSATPRARIRSSASERYWATRSPLASQ